LLLALYVLRRPEAQTFFSCGNKLLKWGPVVILWRRGPVYSLFYACYKKSRLNEKLDGCDVTHEIKCAVRAKEKSVILGQIRHFLLEQRLPEIGRYSSKLVVILTQNRHKQIFCNDARYSHAIDAFVNCCRFSLAASEKAEIVEALVDQLQR
jgi:hypothetical protein